MERPTREGSLPATRCMTAHCTTTSTNCCWVASALIHNFYRTPLSTAFQHDPLSDGGTPKYGNGRRQVRHYWHKWASHVGRISIWHAKSALLVLLRGKQYYLLSSSYYKDHLNVLFCEKRLVFMKYITLETYVAPIF